MQYTLGELAHLAKEEKEFKDMGAEEPAIRKKLRKEVMDDIPSWRLRQDAPKMQLRPGEHEALPLVSFQHPQQRMTNPNLPSSPGGSV